MKLNVKKLVDYLKAELQKPSRRKGVTTGLSLYQEVDGEFCLEISLRPIRWCDDHKQHKPRKRRASTGKVSKDG